MIKTVDGLAQGDQTPRAEILDAIDAAYPFGQRTMHPYKQWLVERRLLIEAVDSPDRVAPTADEVAACEVARDMVEEGRLDEARRVLELAPNRLTMPCPECKANPGAPCGDIARIGEVTVRFNSTDPEAPAIVTIVPALVVPHHARLVGHRGSGPLFGA